MYETAWMKLRNSVLEEAYSKEYYDSIHEKLYSGKN